MKKCLMILFVASVALFCGCGVEENNKIDSSTVFPVITWYPLASNNAVINLKIFVSSIPPVGTNFTFLNGPANDFNVAIPP